MDAEVIAARKQRDQPLGEAGLAAIRAEGQKFGINLEKVRWDEANFVIQVDPCSQETVLCARWASPDVRGMMSIRQDGFVYVEVDVGLPHPKRPVFWIEAITAWGLAHQMRSEPRLLEMPAEA